MGNFDNVLDIGDAMLTGLPGDLVIAAAPGNLAHLRATNFGKSINDASYIALSPDDVLSDAVIHSAGVMVLEVDPASDPSMSRISKVRNLRPDLPIIAAIADANVSLVRALVRQGVTDVAVLPFSPGELAAQILDASATVAARPSNAATAPMVSVVQSGGGGGATSIITHLAAALAAEGSIPDGVCALDLDLQKGDIATYLGKSAKVTIGSLLEAGNRLDGEFLRAALTDSGRGFSFVAAPAEIAPLDLVNADQVMKVLDLARHQFGCVLLDLPADWTNWGLSALATSNRVVIVTGLSIASLRQAKRHIELFKSVGIETDRIKVVVNRVERRLFRTIGVDEVRDALGCEVVAMLTDEGAALSAAQDEGLLITEVNLRSKFGKDVQALARDLLAAAE